VADPIGFAGAGAEPRLIDEVQRAGDPLGAGDQGRRWTRPPRTGRYVLAGSTRFLATPSLSESLAGRGAVVDVWPFSQVEFDGNVDSFIDRAFDEPRTPDTRNLAPVGSCRLPQAGLPRRLPRTSPDARVPAAPRVVPQLCPGHHGA